MKLSSPIKEVKGVGDEIEAKLNRLGINTISDLLNYYPYRYEDYSKITSTKSLKPGTVTIKAVIKQAKGRYVRRGLHITEAIASDETGSVLLIWFNQPYRAAQFKTGQEYFISGEYSLSRQRFSIQNPSVELVSSFPVNTARIVPVYRVVKGLKSGQIRKLLRELIQVIEERPETLPDWLIEEEKLLPRPKAEKAVHFPTSSGELEQAKRRLGFEEVFQLVLAALLNKYELLIKKSLAIEFDRTLAQDFVARLPFKLTDDQRKAVWQIYQDLGRTTPMNRLLEGDVGSGKTVVAAMAAIMAMARDFQVAMMVPTEILARQHAETVYSLFEPLGLGDRVGLLVGSMSVKQKKAAHDSIKEGKIKFIIGTHALITQKLEMHNLGLVIIDEQHRFGVDQRKSLQAKAGLLPHVLLMTATPIPRSLALTLYGDLDISVIATKPSDRQPVETKLVNPTDRPKTFEFAKQQIDAGHQVFVICPLVTDSGSLGIKSAEAVYEQLKNHEFKNQRVGLVHGKLKNEQKQKVMEDFINGRLDVLVSTTVTEVGVNVPNATVMIIENPERFGLAQLHQLRGRVGRSSHKSHCFLLLSDSQPPSRRLRSLEQLNDGFKLAELDLELRGPGAIYGTEQHGQLDLTFAKLTDTKLIAAARSRAQEFIDKKEDLLNYKELARHVNRNRAITNLN